MIKANELMLGNFVDTPDGTVKITAISYEKVAVIRKTEKGNFAVYSESLDDIQPIPLTEEILLKCGFVIEDQKYKYFSHKDIPGILQIFDGVAEYSIDSNDVCWVNSVHQLQNLFYSLVGKEMTVSL